METEEARGGAALSLERLAYRKCVKAAFPIHDYDELRDLSDDWLQYVQLPSDQPFDEIKNYFGERVALYFALLAHYTKYLTYASVAGLMAWAWAALEQNVNAWGVACFGLARTTASRRFLRGARSRSLLDFGARDRPRPGPASA